MRYFLIIVALIAALLAALFTIPLGGDKPLLNWQHVKENWQQPERLFDKGLSPWVRQSGETELYRWRDPEGNWQYGQIPPPGVHAEAVTVKDPKTISAEEMRGGKGLEQTQQQ